MLTEQEKLEIAKKLLNNPRIAERVHELDLNKEQILEALPIMMDMDEQVDDEKTQHLTSFYISANGSIKRMEVRSTYWKKYEYLENVVTQSINPVDFEDEKEFFKEDGRKNIIPYIDKYIKEQGIYHKGLFLYGQMGVGKTFVLKRIARRIAQEGSKVAFINVSELATKVKKMLSQEHSYDEFLTMLKDVDYLFIDDIGAEPVTSWFRDEILFSLLNDRMQKEKTTFFSSNYSYAQLEQVESRTVNLKYKDMDKAARLITRVQALTVPVELTGKNKRY